MPREFMITKILMVLGALVYGLAFLIVPDEAPDSPEPVQVQEIPQSHATLSPTWQEQLSSPEIKSYWQERRLLLAGLSEAYRDEPDSTRRETLRRELVRLIEESEQVITELRHREQGGIP